MKGLKIRHNHELDQGQSKQQAIKKESYKLKKNIRIGQNARYVTEVGKVVENRLETGIQFETGCQS